ncbi:3-deoxy-D-manno-octulosonic acid transferase [Thiohalorhabdus denitrificans]|nr:3-deoxy-D-manno-octulosonic acid transferase [Thiohalorhabdus denitrificans]
MPQSERYLRLLYSLLAYLAVPAVMGRLLVRGVKAPGYRRRWRERFGFPPFEPQTGAIWVHAVSVGEVQAAVPLIRGFLERYPRRTVVVTTTTPTGSDRVKALLGDSVCHSYLPYDLPGAVRRFLQRVDPALAVVMETELWPNLFAACHARAVPLMVVNARLSPRSFRGYRKLRPIITGPLHRAALILTQTEADAERFRALGAPVERVRTAGNLKFDQRLPEGVVEEGRGLRQGWGEERPVWVAASTHEGEEEQVVRAHRQLLTDFPEALLVLVPRHPERFGVAARVVEDAGFPVCRRSGGCQPSESAIYLADTMGELPCLFAAADVAFVGGSLVPTGGHNLLEPAALGLPVVTGPHLFNFHEISALLLEQGGALQVHSGAELGETVSHLFGDPARREPMGRKAREAVVANRGARERILESADRWLANGS